MAEYPAMPLWTDAYLADTTHLSTIENGAYLLLLMAMWRAGGFLPNDDKRLARFARLTPGQWQRIKPAIWGFFEVDGERISQGRLTDELDFVRQHSKRQSDNAKARWLKKKETGDATAMPERCQNDAPTPTPTPIVKESPKSPAGEARLELVSPSRKDPVEEAFETFWSAYPRRPNNPRKPAFERFRSAVRRGAVPEEIIAGARRYADSRKGEDPKFTAMATTWLNQERWTEWAKSVPELRHDQIVMLREGKLPPSLRNGFDPATMSEADAAREMLRRAGR